MKKEDIIASEYIEDGLAKYDSNSGELKWVSPLVNIATVITDNGETLAEIKEEIKEIIEEAPMAKQILTDFRAIVEENPDVLQTLETIEQNKVDKVEGYGLSKNDFTDKLITKLNSIENEANKIEVINNLEETLSGKALDAYQGYMLSQSLETIEQELIQHKSDYVAHKEDYTNHLASELGEEHLINELNGVVDEPIFIDGKLSKIVKKVSANKGEQLQTLTSWIPHAELTNTMIFYKNYSTDLLKNVKRPTTAIEKTIGILNIAGVDFPPRTQLETDAQDVEGFNFTFNNDRIRIRINKARLIGKTSTDFENFLKANEVKLIYALNVPTDVFLPDNITANTNQIIKLIEKIEVLGDGNKNVMTLPNQIWEV